MNKENIHELLGYENIKIIQNDDMFSFSLDSMLLANFIDTTNAKKIIDLGTGNAPILLFLSTMTDAELYGIEIQKEIYDLAVETLKINKLEDRIKIITDELSFGPREDWLDIAKTSYAKKKIMEFNGR